MLTVYEKPSCGTCRRLRELLRERGVEFNTVDYHARGLSEDEVRRLFERLDVPAREVLRRREPVYDELALDDRELGESELVDLLVAHPQLLQRPIVVAGERALLARPVERALELLAVA